MGWAPDYATAAELAAYVRIGDTNDDVQLGLALTAASRAIDRTCRRQFGKVAAATARYYTARVDAVTGRWAVDIDDLMTTTDLAIAVDTAADGTYPDTLTDYTLTPRNAAADGEPWTTILVGPDATVAPSTLDGGVRVTAVWGWSAVPDTIKQACLLQASRLLGRRDAPFGVAGSPESGAETRLLAKVDPDVAVLLRHYTRRWFAI